jgi:transglutaminase-like putative cysteine protease
MSKGDNYYFQYLDVDFGSPYLREIIRKAGDAEPSEPDPKRLTAYAKSLYQFSFSFTEDQKAPTEPYLNSDGLTDRIRALSDQITKGKETDYDKAMAIETYLRGYTYDYKANSGGDLEQFLFETKTGYCVHFASSMVLLLRAQGIPARYCEGYLYRFKEPDPKNGFLVSSADAHAWAEGYMEGFGWIPLEATPAMYTASDYSWNRTLPSDTEIEIDTEKEEPVEANVEFIPEEIEPEEIEPEETKPEVHQYARTLLVVVIFLVSFFIAGLFIRLIAGRIRYLRMTPREKALYEFRLVRKRYLKKIRLKNDNLSMRTILYEIRNRWTEEPAPDIDTILNLWYEVRFGGLEEVSDDQLKEIKRLRKYKAYT